MSEYQEFDHIVTPQSWKDGLYDKIKSGKRVFVKRRKLTVAIAAVIVLTVILSGAVLADTLAGGEFFTRLFQEKASYSANDYSYMDTDQLASISGTIGTVLDTNELKIELADNVCSGNTAMLLFRVTAKKMDSVLLYTGWDAAPLNNYRFDSEDGDIFGKQCTSSTRYVYSDEDSSLKKNQFYIMYLIVNTDNTQFASRSFVDGGYTFRFNSFGYIPVSKGSMETLYEGPWEFTVKLNDGAGYSRIVQMDKSVSIDNLNVTFNEITVTPFALTLSCYCESVKESESLIVSGKLSEDVSVTLKDGTILVPDTMTESSSDGTMTRTERDIRVTIMSGISDSGSSTWRGTYVIGFNVPVAVGEVESVNIGNIVLSLDE
ncbi:MAG: hypothetical protein AAGU75_20060 [Bacillota bacterium]